MAKGAVVWRKVYKEGFCVIANPEGFDKQFLLLEGIPLTECWPAGVVCRMSARYPKDIELSDSLYGGNYPVISKRLKEAISQGDGGARVEYLPVTILNHKERVASADYFVVNPLDTIDCIDKERSGVRWNNINPNVISSLKMMVLNEDAIPSNLGVFRPRHMLAAYLMSRGLADALTTQGFTGLSFTETEKYRG